MNELFRQDNDFRIQELTVESPTHRTESPFDPERDISANDWAEIKNYIDRYRYTDNPSVIFEYAADLGRAFRLFPKRKSEFVIDQSFTDEVERILAKDVDDYLDNGKVGKVLQFVSMIRTLGLPVNLDAVYDHIESTIKHVFTHTNTIHQSLAHQAFPRQVEPFLASGLDIFALCEQLCVGARDDYTYNPDVCFLPYVRRNIEARILFPDRLDKFMVTEDFWPHAHQKLSECVNRKDLLTLATDLKTLAAEKIIVDESGVQLILNAPKPVEESELPQQRRYS